MDNYDSVSVEAQQEMGIRRESSSYVPALRREYDSTSVAAISGDIVAQDITPVFTPVQAVREATSARDRAHGLIVRSLPLLGLAVVFAIVGTIIVSLIMDTTTGEKVLTALTALFMAYGAGYVLLSRQEFQHSGAGVERFRIHTAADVRKTEIAAELQLRQEALQASLALLERQNDDRY